MNDASSPLDIEKLGAFYLGRTVAPSSPVGQPYLYDANHLTTHAVVIGMTGSGKTGLSIALLEEAAIDGIPALVIDPKGDLGNLLLTFPELRAEDFAPWVPQGTDAGAESDRWREGLAAWGQDGARIQRLRESAEVTVYTPGSRVGTPLSITGSLMAPPIEARDDAESLNERIAQVATSLLGLVGIQAEPGKSREHVLVASILQNAWIAGENLDLEGLVVRIQDPPFERLGVLSLESFFPKKDRFELAVAYNAMLAAPGFDAWTSGAPLDVASLLWTKEGKPRISVISIAHLGDAERMFFVSLFLGQVVAWVRTQPGTSSLRALLFMDEVFGFFPPVATPPSKKPLLTLLKQARAFGLGVVLATQNPVDLDYKGLANAGTWIIGRLQTERDKARILEGLEGAGVGQGGQGFDLPTIDRTISALGKRQFYVHDVHASSPTVIESRWAMSYLRGPLTKDELKRVTGAASKDGGSARSQVVAASSPSSSEKTSARPVCPPGVPEVFFPTTSPRAIYRPVLVGAARVQFADAKTGLDFARDVMFMTPFVDGPLPIRWDDAKWAGSIDVRALGHDPVSEARFVLPPEAAFDPKRYAGFSKDFVAWLTRTQGVARLWSAEHKTFSEPNEDERAFRSRLALRKRESRDAEATKLREKYGTKLAALEAKIRQKQEVVARAGEQVNAQRMDVAFSMAGAFLGRGVRGAMSSASRAAKSASRASAKADTRERAQQDLSELTAQYNDLQREGQEALAKIAAAYDPANLAIESVVSKPKKTGISVHLVALAWRADS